jgi:hypothetical protein
MENNAFAAIQAVNNGQLAFCKFLSPNDTGDTGGHQAGIYIAKNAWSILFDTPGVKGNNKERAVSIKWQNKSTVENFIEVANKLLNSRKSRAGKSLEHHLSEIFRINQVNFDSQCISEGKKRPDFIFPSEEAYQNKRFPAKHLTFLAVKRTCKDRWRQIINEADRIKNKHLFTLQQGISLEQLEEMESVNITLVVPKSYIKSYPSTKRKSIWTLQRFIHHVKNKTS